MISLDCRTGSKELAPKFLPFGIQVQTATLPYGDLAFEGNGPSGRCSIVIERKRIEDLIASMQSRRLSGHQLPGMAETYDYCYLIVEGMWRPDQDGCVQTGWGRLDGSVHWGGGWIYPKGKKPMHYRAIDNYLSTLELQAGVIVRRTLTADETVFVAVDLYHWWNDKQWSEHSAHVAVYAPADPKLGPGRRIHLAMREVSLCEKWAMQLPGIDAKARQVAQHFHSAQAMANAGVSDWIAIQGIGPVTAKKVVREIQERSSNASLPVVTD